jgi:hypothetical protein
MLEWLYSPFDPDLVDRLVLFFIADIFLVTIVYIYLSKYYLFLFSLQIDASNDKKSKRSKKISLEKI